MCRTPSFNGLSQHVFDSRQNASELLPPLAPTLPPSSDTDPPYTSSFDRTSHLKITRHLAERPKGHAVGPRTARSAMPLRIAYRSCLPVVTASAVCTLVNERDMHPHVYNGKEDPLLLPFSLICLHLISNDTTQDPRNRMSTLQTQDTLLHPVPMHPHIPAQLGVKASDHLFPLPQHHRAQVLGAVGSEVRVGGRWLRVVLCR